MVGEVGGGTRQEQLALGETPNLAARLQGLAAPNTLVISAATWQLLSGFFACQALGPMRLHGRAQPLEVYQVLSETTAATCITVIREAMEESIRRGVPRAAARDFILGHLNIEMAIVFEEIGSPFSDGAKKAIEKAKGQIFRPDWKKVFDAENVRDTVAMITQPPSSRVPAPALQT